MKLYPIAAIAILVLGEAIIDVASLLIDAVSAVAFGTVVIGR